MTFATKREKQVEFEETTDMPTYADLVHIVQEIAVWKERMEEKVARLEKQTSSARKVKIDPAQWLNANVSPEYDYSDLLAHIDIDPSHTERLFENKIYDVLSVLFATQFQKGDVPLAYLKNELYCYAASTGWIPIPKKEFVCTLNKIHQQLLGLLTDWQKKNADKIEKSDKLGIQYNKALIKLMDISFTQEATLTKIKTILAGVVGYEVKQVVEYEIE